MNICGIGLLLVQIQLGNVQPGNVSGIVTKPGGTEPLPGATVVLNPVALAEVSRVRSTLSEDDGRFAIRDIEPGEYRLEVQSPQFGSATYGQRKPPNGPGAILAITAGQSLSDLKVAMMPTGTIAGRVTGRSGEPIAYANVQALRFLYQEGKRILAVAQSTITDDHGNYRLFWLASGKYVVVAGPRGYPIGTATVGPLRPGEVLRTGIGLRGAAPPAFLEGTDLTKRILADGTIQEESWMPTYYPSTIDRAQAAAENAENAVNVTAGATVTGIDITLGPSPVRKIRGRVVGFTGTATVSLASGNQGMNGQSISRTASNIDGSFEFGGVVAGSYVLTAQDSTGRVSTPAVIPVGDRDLENISIGMTMPVALRVQIKIEGAGSDVLSGVTGSLRSDMDSLPGGSPSNLRTPNTPLGAADPSFASVPPGDYQFSISQVVRENMKPLFIKSIRLGREDASGTIHVLPETKDVLEVVLTAETGSVEGLAMNRAGDPAANATVVLVPANARKRIALYKTLVTASDGKFRFQEIPPGDYKLFAWDDIETGAWENAEFIRSYESRGRVLRVSEKSKDVVQLDVIYNP